MTRALSSRVRRKLAASGLDEALLAFLTISHPNLPEPIRLVSDPVDHEYNGAVFTGLPFEIALPNDNDSEPRVEVAVPNVDRLLGEHVLSADGEVRCDLEVLSSASFLDRDAVTGAPLVPRIEAATVEVLGEWREVTLDKVSINPLVVSGTLSQASVLSEPFSPERATADRFPGLFK